MDKDQLRSLITRVLKAANLYSESATELLMLTAAVESNLGQYIKQKGKGPALGIFQMEPATEDDIWNNYLSYKSSLREIVHEFYLEFCFDEIKNLEYNLAYQILMARIHYLRVPSPLPEIKYIPMSMVITKTLTEESILSLANYWKVYYNTIKGKGTIEKAVNKYNKYCI